MRILLTIPPSLAVILNFIESSSQFECLPNGDPMPYVSRSRPSSPSSSAERNNSPERYFAPAEYPIRARSRSAQANGHSPLRTRTSIITTSEEFTRIVRRNYRSIRLTSRANALRKFELRMYTFPADAKIELRVGNDRYGPMPIEGQITLSSFDDEVFAILRDNETLSGMYASYSGQTRRAKINMESGTVSKMTSAEVKEIPVGVQRPMIRFYEMELENDVSTEITHTINPQEEKLQNSYK